MKFEKTIKVKKEQAEKFQALLNMEEVDFEGLGVEEDAILASFTTVFNNGFFIDINVCSGQHNCWVDAILHDIDGQEVVLDEPSDELLGPVSFTYEEHEYCVNLVAED